MESTPTPNRDVGNESPPRQAGSDRRLHSRRDIVRHGVKLAFVAPALSTLLVEDAIAAGSNHSCYPIGHDCGAGHLEPCCSGNCDEGATDKCI